MAEPRSSAAAASPVRAQLEQAQWPLARGRPAAGERTALAAAYAGDGSHVYWSGARGPTPQALQLLDLLRRAAEQGLDPADYDADALAAAAARLAARGGAAAADVPATEAADFDRTLTAAALRYALHLHYGRVSPGGAGYNLKAGPAPFDTTRWLTDVAGAADVRVPIARIEPQFLHYRLLQQALVHYRELATDGDRVALPPLRRRSLRQGDAYSGTPVLRRLLARLGDLPADQAPEADATGEVLDAPLVAALARFQARHGLTADGVLGAGTLAALEVPLSQRIRQIVLTLERWRWLPPFQPRQIIVNIPQFRLFAFDSAEDRVAGTLQMAVIAGGAYAGRETPVFAADIEYVVFRPYWDVPRSIVVRELLPLIAKSPDYLARNGMELIRGQGDDSPVVAPTAENLAALQRGELRLRQRPGGDNALGLVKFVLPNNYDVYLHDTPAQRGFLRARRDLSHGCIRVQDPVDLAAFVLHDEPGGWSNATIEAAMHATGSRRVKLEHPVHVMILYGTALAVEDGRILFFDDIYGLDRRLAELLRRAAVTG